MSRYEEALREYEGIPVNSLGDWIRAINISEFRIFLEKDVEDGSTCRCIITFDDHDFCGCTASSRIFHAASEINRELICHAVREAWGNGP